MEHDFLPRFARVTARSVLRRSHCNWHPEPDWKPRSAPGEVVSAGPPVLPRNLCGSRRPADLVGERAIGKTRLCDYGTGTDSLLLVRDACRDVIELLAARRCYDDGATNVHTVVADTGI